MWCRIFLELKLLHLFAAFLVVLVEADATFEFDLAAYGGRMVECENLSPQQPPRTHSAAMAAQYQEYIYQSGIKSSNYQPRLLGQIQSKPKSRNEEAENFNMEEYQAMQKAVVIAVSSTWVTEKYRGLQLTATLATHYYLNPVHCILNIYKEFIDPVATLETQRQRYPTEEQEQSRNRYSLESVLNVNP
ncbi:hypothetical protein Tco_1385643 [Tanacetum coccineum]